MKGTQERQGGLVKYTEEELVAVARRENNEKRKYLVVNRLQGKHVPVSPQKRFGCSAVWQTFFFAGTQEKNCFS